MIATVWLAPITRPRNGKNKVHPDCCGRRYFDESLKKIWDSPDFTRTSQITIPLQSALPPAAKKTRRPTTNRSLTILKIPKNPPNPASDNRKRVLVSQYSDLVNYRVQEGSLKTKNQKLKTVQSPLTNWHKCAIISPQWQPDSRTPHSRIIANSGTEQPQVKT